MDQFLPDWWSFHAGIYTGASAMKNYLIELATWI
jgi:hypothetical protein